MKLSKAMKAFGYLFFVIQLAFLQADDASKISLDRQKDVNAYIEDFPHFQEGFYLISDGTVFERQRALYNFIDDRLDDKKVNFGDVIEQVEDEIKNKMYPYFVKANFDVLHISHPIIRYIMKYKDTKFQPILQEWLAGMQDDQGKTPLHYAALSRTDKIVQFLIAVGIDVNMQDNSGKTALHYAASCKADSIAQLLLKAGADVNIQDYEGQTALHEAACHKAYSIARLLLEAGADVDIQDDEGETALHWAIFYKADKIVGLLLAAQANEHMQDHEGRAPWHWEGFHEEDMITRLLLETETN